MESFMWSWLPFAWSLLVDVAIEGVIVLMITALVVKALGRASAAMRHLIWSTSLVSLAILPALTLALPGWSVLPAEWTIGLARSLPAPAKLEVVPNIAIRTPSIATEPLANPPVNARGGAPAPLPPSPMPSWSETQRAPEPPAIITPPTSPLWVEVIFAALVLWLCGVVFSLTFALAGWLVLFRIEYISRVADDPFIAATAKLARRIGVTRPVRVLFGDDAAMPMTWGILAPRIPLPNSASSWTVERREAILTHELAHVRRRDFATHLFARVVVAIHWFNPLTWHAARHMAVERERACDDLVLNSGCAASIYAEHLLFVGSRLGGRALAQSAAVAMARNGDIEDRIRAVLDGEKNRRDLSRRTLGVVVLSVMATTAPLAFVRLTAAEREFTANVRPPSTTLAAAPVEDGATSNTTEPVSRSPKEDVQSIQGTVVDEEDRGIAGADVWLRVRLSDEPISYATDDHAVVHARSADDGRFTLEVSRSLADLKKAQSGFELCAHAPRYRFASIVGTYFQTTDKPEWKIVLATEADTTFLVLDETGKPVTGAVIEPMGYRSPWSISATDDGSAIDPVIASTLAVTTGAEGRARMASFERAELMEVLVRAPEFGTQSYRLKAAASQPTLRELILSDVARIEGRIVADDPRLATNVSVYVVAVQEAAPSLGPRYFGRPYGRATTDSQGRFVVERLARGKATLRVLYDPKVPFRPRLPEELELAAGKTTRVDIAMERAVRAHGVVVPFLSGEPYFLEGTMISTASDAFMTAGDLVSTATDGTYEVLVPPGTTLRRRIFSLPPDHWGASVVGMEPIEIPVGVDAVELPPIWLVIRTPDFELNGRLVDADGRAIEGSTVVAMRTYPIQAHTSYQTDGEGRFVIQCRGEFSPTQFVVQRPNSKAYFNAEVVTEEPLVLRVDLSTADNSRGSNQRTAPLAD